MDPIGMVISAYQVAVAIKSWIDRLEERNESMQQIGVHVVSVFNVLEPLRSKTLTAPEHVASIWAPAVASLGAALNKTLEHLRVWEARQRRKFTSLSKIVAFVTPETVTAIFQSDEKRISRELTVLLFTMSTISFIQSQPDSTRMQPVKPQPLKWIRNAEVVDLWERPIGADVTPDKTKWLTDSYPL